MRCTKSELVYTHSQQDSLSPYKEFITALYNRYTFFVIYIKFITRLTNWELMK